MWGTVAHHRSPAKPGEGNTMGARRLHERQSGRWSTGVYALAAMAMLHMGWFFGWYLRFCGGTWVPPVSGLEWLALVYIMAVIVDSVVHYSAFVFSGIALVLLLFRFVVPPVREEYLRKAWIVVGAGTLTMYVIAQLTTKFVGCSGP